MNFAGWILDITLLTKVLQLLLLSESINSSHSINSMPQIRVWFDLVHLLLFASNVVEHLDLVRNFMVSQTGIYRENSCITTVYYKCESLHEYECVLSVTSSLNNY